MIEMSVFELASFACIEPENSDRHALPKFRIRTNCHERGLQLRLRKPPELKPHQ